ncbi:hypothetical protein BS78_04G000400 [Paspalum vaginatum]|nr:hypothetical protein BS78_04G000400 [Paspalum vaginatum]
MLRFLQNRKKQKGYDPFLRFLQNHKKQRGYDPFLSHRLVLLPMKAQLSVFGVAVACITDNGVAVPRLKASETNSCS